MQVPPVVSARRWTQWIVAGVVAVVGVRFSQWAAAHLDGRWPDVARPPGVEAFLPINAMLGLRHLVGTGVVDAVHPAGVAIFIGICLMSLVVAKSFCSHLCPVGLLSELLGRLGLRLTGRTVGVPRWLDLPLRGLKFLLLGFFVQAIWFQMSPSDVAAFLSSPYARVADVKMWMFFADPSRVTVAVLGVLVVGSVFVRDLWCRYLCPYGALLGVLGRLAPLKVRRNASLCTDCRACTRACPARLPVHALQRVASVECTSCQDCVVACPVSGCLAVRPPAVGALRYRPSAIVATAVAVYAITVGGFRIAGWWHTSITESEYHARLDDIRSPVYAHVGGRPMTEPRAEDRPVAGVPGHDRADRRGAIMER
jgi:ferredoxin